MPADGVRGKQQSAVVAASGKLAASAIANSKIRGGKTGPLHCPAKSGRKANLKAFVIRINGACIILRGSRRGSGP